MLHRITGRATKCGPSAISAIAGVPTHEAAALAEFCWTPDYALRHPKYRNRRFARREPEWERIFAGIPFDQRAVTLGTFLDPAPAGTWAISASNHFVAYADGFVADSGAWFSRKPAFWSRAIPDHDRVALRRVQEAVRFVRVSGDGNPRNAGAPYAQGFPQTLWPT